MKSGSGDDLLNELEQDADDDSQDKSEKVIDKEADDDGVDTPSNEDESSTDSDQDVPYLLLRSEVKDRRDVVGIGLQETTRNLEREILNDLEDEIGVSNLPVMDLREAAYLVGLRHADETKEVLLNWGYEHRG